LKIISAISQTDRMIRKTIRKATSIKAAVLTAALAAPLAVMLALAGATPVHAVDVSPTYRKNAEREFSRWLQDLWPEAQQRGVSRTTFDRAVRRIKLQWSIPDLDPPKIGNEDPRPSPKRQAEFGSPGGISAKNP
jgi:membrane-bound lytic murein transglycosylase B